MTAYTNTRDNSILTGVGYKDGDTLTTVNGSKWVYQNEGWHPIAFGGNPEEAPLTVRRSSGVIGKFDFARRTGSTVVLRSSGADSIGAAVTTVQRLDSFNIPAGALKLGDTLRFTLGFIKSGASDTATFKVCVGTTDSTSDATIVTPVLAATAASYGAIHAFKVVSSTAFRQIGVNSGNNSLPGTSANVAATPVAVGNFSASDIYIGVYCTMSSGSEFPTMRSHIVELIPEA